MHIHSSLHVCVHTHDVLLMAVLKRGEEDGWRVL